MNKPKLEWLKSSKLVFGAMVAGALIGLYAPKVGFKIAFLGEGYLALLKMCVLPIVITALTTSFARMLKSGDTSVYLKRMGVVFGTGLLLASSTGVFLGAVFGPRILSNPDVRVALGEIISSGKVEQATQAAPTRGMVASIVPENIFYSLTHSQMVPVLMFFILLGIALGKDKKGSGTHFLAMAEGLREAFLTIMGWFIYLLPLGILGLFAGTFAASGGTLLTVLISLLSVIMIGIIALLTAQFALLSIVMRQSPLKLLRELKEPLMIAVGTSSSFAALPSIMRTLQTKYKMEEWLSGFLAPLAVTFNGWAGALFNSFIVIFITRVYDIPLGLEHILIAAFGAIVQSWSSSGLPATASVLSMVVLFRPMGIPLESMVGLLLALLPILDPFFTLLNVTANLTANLVIRFAKFGSKR